MTAVSQPLARFVADLDASNLPPAVLERAKTLALDLSGSIVRAGRDGEPVPSVLAALERLGLGAPGSARVVGSGRRLAPPVAALVNGVLGHALDFDDTHADSSLHPSAPVVPAALAVGEAVGASGRDVALAIVAGYEVCCRLGMALDPASHYARGFHPTATAGTFGAAAAAAKLYGLDEAGILAAFGVAGSQAAGSLQFLENGAWNKPWQVGQAAMNGVIAGALAAEGFRGASDPIEGRHGLFAGYTDAAAPDKAVADLGAVFETMRIGVKPYPGCRYTHAALDGLAALRREEGLTPENVSAVTIGLHRNGMRLVGEPIDAKRRAASVVDGQFSMPFSAAVMIAKGSFGWDDYARLRDPTIEAIARRIDVRRDESLEGLRHPFGAVLEVVVGERRLSRRIADPSGEPETFPGDAAMRAKFLALADPVLGGRAATLADWIMDLDRHETLAGMPVA